MVDVLARPVPLETAIGGGRLIESEPLVLTTGGIVSNAGITLARLGMRVAAFTYVGNDEWADVVRRRFAAEGHRHVGRYRECRASHQHVRRADRSRAASGASSITRARRGCFDKQTLLARLDLFARSRAMLIGYYPLMTRLQDDLPEVLAAIRATGCLTALDAAGDGGTMEPLARILPHLDFYLPNEIGGRASDGLR